VPEPQMLQKNIARCDNKSVGVVGNLSESKMLAMQMAVQSGFT